VILQQVLTQLSAMLKLFKGKLNGK